MGGQWAKEDRVAAMEPFVYAHGPAPALPDWLESKAGVDDPEMEDAREKHTERAEAERRMGEETLRQFEAGRLQGQEEGREAERELLEDRVQRELAGLVESFAVERDRYLRAVEREVVRLSLAVAARILRREAQMDPLLLTGAVRVALGQLAASTQVRLRVPAGQLELWVEAVGLLPNLPLKPQVVADEGMRIGDCRVEAELGSVDLGVGAQLKEIEREFFDSGDEAAGAECAPALRGEREG